MIALVASDDFMTFVGFEPLRNDLQTESGVLGFRHHPRDNVVALRIQNGREKHQAPVYRHMGPIDGLHLIRMRLAEPDYFKGTWARSAMFPLWERVEFASHSRKLENFVVPVYPD